jgi:DNA-binding transcriptional LysR family regulator
MFVAVVQAGSLSAAAARLEVPLPTLSRRIRELERQLKVQLVERSVRGTRVTDAGTRLYEYASRGIEALTEGAEAVIGDQVRVKGRLRLSLPPSFLPWWDLLASFQARYPDVRIHVYTTERQVDLVEDGIDVALRVGTIIHEAMVARKLLSYRHVLVASPRLVGKLGTPKTPDSLHRFPCAAWTKRADGRCSWRLGQYLFDCEPVLSTNDYLQLRRSATEGEVVTELPPFLAADAIRAKALVALLPKYPMPEQAINLLYPSHRHPSSVVRTYLDFCQENAAQFVNALRASASASTPSRRRG